MSRPIAGEPRFNPDTGKWRVTFYLAPPGRWTRWWRRYWPWSAPNRRRRYLLHHCYYRYLRELEAENDRALATQAALAGSLRHRS